MMGEEKGQYVDMANGVEFVPPEDALINHEEFDNDEVVESDENIESEE